MDVDTGSPGQDGSEGTPMGKEDASRIQSAADRDPASDTATSGFAQRAQSAADRAVHRDR
ncbi:hypothetical protein [Saccharothrix obliqua]|uniref:hypothetical protein n=1 Tax=Saccharothrix obliqua TaxID=2861747 RepID=UPI001C5D67DD|nr:hypothetical protein [Saccharothrix obliqua]MBW4722299.1 hypothetical protein [Saccharothrix obliqua]